MLEIIDGAMGTMLMAGGLEVGACPELMNVEKEEVVRDIHKRYIEAGATIVETNTFGGSPLKLAHYGIEERCEELNGAAVRIARKAAGNGVKVAGSMGPTGRFVEPVGDLPFDEAYESFYKQAKALSKDDLIDFFILETFIDLQELRVALLAAKDAAPNVPIIAQMSFSEDMRTVTGTDPVTAAVTLEALGASVVGANCSLGPKELLPVVEKLASVANCPVSALPNAGMPYLENGETKFPMTPKDFGECGKKLYVAGARFLGGCCGTTPEHIRELKAALSDTPKVERQTHKPMLYLTSRTKTVTIDSSLPTRIIGERINPTGRKKLAADIQAGSLLSVKKEALGEVRAGASILDVNMGAPNIDEVEMMKKAVTELSLITDAPLVIDTGNAEALEAALKAYPGRALINSVTLEKERLEKFLPLAKRYGAATLCLPVTSDGVPKTAKERVKVMAEILEAAKKTGLKKGDFILDALVMTVSADKNAALEVFETLRTYREKFDLPTTMGLSNISFGLPERPTINSVFFAMSLAAGLNAPIMNPYDEEMKRTLAASSVLTGKDPSGIEFSKTAAKNAEQPKKQTNNKTEEIANPVEALKQAVKDGEKEAAKPLAEKAIAEGFSADEITNNALTAAMEEIGVDFGAGRMFLPQVLLSAETMREAFNTLKEHFPADESKTLGTVVLATVKGDVHDLGKNIVGALLTNSGFKVVDLGKDVPRETIISAAKENNADIIGLCALMTTTMGEIPQVIAATKNAELKTKIMVGGAAVTKDFAESAEADAYARDAVEAVKLAKEMVS
ncbi:MAG: homocysteine S-methyltransferase family protein [Selenomonadaceae bacterium]|nr:homocysteine S-methyltransferase family protein [Selenomonadaceae bacterium]